MPKFELMPLDAAMAQSATGKRAQIIGEYVGYIEELKAGQAGKLQVTAGEKVAGVRRRLGAAARAAGKDLAIRRVGDEIYFWPRDVAGRGRRRGRPRKAAGA